MADYREIAVRFRRNPAASVAVGILAERDASLFFEYDREWLAGGLELSPFTLPLAAGLIAHRDLRFGPLFGLFDDSLPDGWGLLLMDRFFRSKGMDPARISILDRLLYLGTGTMGALTYHPAVDRGNDVTLPGLNELAAEALQVYAGKTKDILPQLMRAGGSPGGARPKVLVGFNPDTHDMVSGESDIADGFEHWIIKFSSFEDLSEAGPVEYAYSLMATAAGVEMEETRLFADGAGGQFFGVKRFDRLPGNRRLHVHTFANLIHADFRVPVCDYADLLKATSLLTRNHLDLERAYRLMVYNILAHNRDDHAKNFSFLLDDQSGEWSLSPAYDLTFARGPGGEHFTTVLGEGMQPTRGNCRQLAAQAGITADRAETIFDQVAEAVGRWPEFADLAGVGKKTSQEIATFFDSL